MPPAFRLLHTDDLRARIENERLDAAEQEFVRHDRVRRATATILATAVEQLQAMCDSPFAVDLRELRSVAGSVEGVLEVLQGEWLTSPRTMAVKRATTGAGR